MLDRQQSLAGQFREVARGLQRLESQCVTLEARSRQLRRSLLAEAFAGRLVAQDPADEPASVLLERIRAERAVQPKPVRAGALRRAAERA